MIGSFPATDATGLTEVADGTANPETWSAELNSGGVGISSGQFMNLHAFAGDPTSAVLTAVKTTAGIPTVWSFDATDPLGNTTHCA
ncbi:MAG: hypothetical protein QOJ25_2174 [Solirubrobacteraceae bacterium]|jgi:hypothetical protein|nr:hypothetical protein [Solirubrobacteraceae bacterium]